MQPGRQRGDRRQRLKCLHLVNSELSRPLEHPCTDYDSFFESKENNTVFSFLGLKPRPATKLFVMTDCLLSPYKCELLEYKQHQRQGERKIEVCLTNKDYIPSSSPCRPTPFPLQVIHTRGILTPCCLTGE
ncbi:SH3 domain-binding glutamic acid-rich-like protein 2 isoform X4 [Rhinatrema bivittatum]|uniref:SH3 domain-binding glutamic acid-rich-like protein 2 isoform X4 n=1 Tax=Rhinatrema bivittatum TaxID=194408 RepID=UPI00112CB669|nr:SH3 domain-binding glutamic acid-rich-like protein 2 isoform X4 [Rhinatrema bivittatum]